MLFPKEAFKNMHSSLQARRITAGEGITSDMPKKR